MASYERAVLLIALLMGLTLVLLWMPPLEKTGGVITRASIVQQNFSSCSLPLEAGWNLISYPCIPFAGAGPAAFLESINDSAPTLHAYDPTSVTDPWKAYKTGLPSWVVQDISSVSDIRGYWIYVNSATSINVNSTITTPRTIPVFAGWNLVGYPTHSARPVNISLATLHPDWREIRRWNYTSSSYETFDNATQSGDLYNMTEYSGYWLYMGSAGTWMITW